MITIYIPTYNRPNELEQTLRYWSDSATDYNFIICDSSLPEIAKKNRELASNLLPGSIFKIFSYNYNPSRKLLYALELSVDEFFIIQPDDDVIIKSSLQHLVEEMKINSEIQIISGYHLGFSLANKVHKIFDIYNSCEFMAESSNERLISYFEMVKATPLLYCLMRRKCILNIFQIMENKRLIFGTGLHQGNFIEHFFNAHMISHSKLYVSNLPLYLRSEDTVSQWKRRDDFYSKLKYAFHAKITKKIYLYLLKKRAAKASDEIAHVLDYKDSKLSDLIGETVMNRIRFNGEYNRSIGASNLDKFWSLLKSSTELSEDFKKIKELKGINIFD